MRNAFLAAAMGLALAVPVAPSHAADHTVVDAAGRTITIRSTDRIVAIGGAVTEILYALGLDDQIAAVDVTSTWPPAATEKPSVGYMRTLSPEGVLSLAPDLILAIEGSGPAETIAVLEKASIPFVLVPEAHDGEGVLKKVRFIADAVGVAEKGEELAEAISEDLATVAGMRKRIETKRSAVFVLAMSGGSPMVAGEDTSAEGVFALAGVDNALTGFTGFKRANEEATMAAQPDAVVVMAERGHALTADKVFAVPAFATTPAAKEKRLVSLPGSYLLGFGPRVAHAARDLAAGVYPELVLPALPERPWTGHEPADAGQ